jgi:DNA primase
MHTTGRTYFESVRFIRARDQATNLEDDIAKALIVKPDYTQFDEVLIKRLSAQALDSPRATGYFLGRKITQESMKKFLLGFSENQDMVTVPVHAPDGMPVGFVGRSVEGKEFKNTPGLPKAKLLFNLHRVKAADRVYVVESSFDAIRLDQCEFPAVATLGSNVSNFQIDLLQKYFNNIIVIADNDEAGGNMKARILEKIGSKVTVIQLNKEYKDIGDMSDEEIRSIDISFDKSIANMLN